jgi:hypothetical protein
LFEDWSYSWSGTSLLGTLAIDHYAAAHKEEGALCYHSASLAARYIPASGETAIDWVQLFKASYSKTTTNGYLPPNTWTVDPWPNDGTDGGPFYFSNKDNPYSYYTGSGGTNSQTAGTKYFGDSPYFRRLEVNPHTEEVNFYLLLCSADTASKTVVLYDAIQWGYDGTCIPEPTTSTLLGLGTLALVMARKRK